MSSRTRSTLLLVEDHQEYGSRLADGLQRQSFEVTWVQSLREARKELELVRFRIAVLDVGLPDGSGMDLCQEIRMGHPATATVLLSSAADPSRRLMGLRFGADDYVSKTSHFQEILLRIQNAIVRRRNWQDVPESVVVGRASINFAAQEAMVGGERIRLSAREAGLLRFLLARRGMVVSRDEILDEVWSPDEYPTPRTVDNFVMRLRQIVEVNPENPEFLRSVRGVGYQLVPSPS